MSSFAAISFFAGVASGLVLGGFAMLLLLLRDIDRGGEPRLPPGTAARSASPWRPFSSSMGD